MKTSKVVPVLLAVILGCGMLATAQAQTQPGRWLHVRVTSADKEENVRVNLPLKLAEAVLPAIKANKLENGKIKVDQVKIENVDVRALLDAMRNAQDGEFVTVEDHRHDVHVAKKNGYLLVQVREDREAGQAEGRTKTVDVKLPFVVCEALLSGGKDELDISGFRSPVDSIGVLKPDRTPALAAVRALSNAGDGDLVTVKDGRNTVRIWVDTKNTTD